MKEHPLKQLGTCGQSIWLDYIRRHLIVSGELLRLIEENGLGGMTSNPSIFEKAIAGTQIGESKKCVRHVAFLVTACHDREVAVAVLTW